MPPKTADKKKGRAIPPGGVTILGACDTIKGNCAQIFNEITGKPVRKVDAAAQLWTYSMKGEKQREEILKGQPVQALIQLLERGAPEERMAACGCLYALAQSTKHIAEVVNNRLIMAVVALMGGNHDRGRQPAAQFLSFLAQRPEYSNRVADNALLLLLEGCRIGSVPGWGGARITMLHCVTALRSLIENVQCEQNEPKQVRRNTLIVHGAVSTLVQLLSYTPRLPEPLKVPATPPTAVGKGGGKGKGAAKGKKGKGKGKGSNRLPAGRKDCIATQASACLRFLALVPDFMPELIASNCLDIMLSTLITSSDEQAAYICGILWEASSDLGVAQQIVKHQGIRYLLHICSTCLLYAKAQGKGRAKAKKGEPSKDDKKAKQAPPPPPSFPDIAICNATGILHHLTFLDQAKAEVGQLGGVPILALCLKIAAPQTKDNATGALYNLGMDPANIDALAKAPGLPSYLSCPMPKGWLLAYDADVGEVDEEEDFLERAADVLAGNSFFVTAGPAPIP